MPKNVPNPESGSSGNIPVPGGMHHSLAPGSGSGSSSNKIRIPGGRMPKNVPNPESGSSGNIPVPGGMHHSPTK